MPYLFTACSAARGTALSGSLTTECGFQVALRAVERLRVSNHTVNTYLDAADSHHHDPELTIVAESVGDDASVALRKTKGDGSAGNAPAALRSRHPEMSD